MRLLPFIFSAFIFSSASIACSQPLAKNADKDSSSTATIKFPAPAELPMLESVKDIENITKHHGSDLLVVNFWATFCAPCVEEMPYFVELSKKYPEKQVRVVGMTVDLKSQIETVAKPFLKAKQIPYSNFHVYADDQGDAIKFFSKDWDGALPVTFFYDKSGKKLGEILEPVTPEQLNQKVKELLKQIATTK